MSRSARRSHSWFVATALMALLAQAAPGQRERLDRLPQDEEAMKFLPIDFSAFLTAVELPGKGPLHGLATLNGLLWVARGDALIAFDLESQKVVRQRSLPDGLLGLAADGRFLYVLNKDAVQVLDAMAMELVRRLPLSDAVHDDGPCAIACLGDQVYVATKKLLVASNRVSGEARVTPVPVSGLQWLASDGVDLWGGSSNAIHRIEAAHEGRATNVRRLPHPVQRGAGAFVGKLLLCAFDYREAGKALGEQHAAGYWQPEKVALLEERLSLKVFRDQQGLKYELGPKPMRKLEGVKLELARIAKLPECKIPGPDGLPILMSVELEAFPGVTVKDLGAAWDAVTAAGFVVELCSQTAAARQIEEPPPPPPPPPPVGKKRG